MAIKQQSYQITGMRQDNLVGTNTSNKFAHEIMNLRLNTIGDYTTAAWTTEQGTLPKPVDWSNAPSDALELLIGSSAVTNMIVPIGQAVVNDQWVVFATQTLLCETDPEYKGVIGYDFIFKYWYQENSDQLMGTILYAGHLNFDAQHPCETLPFYENEDVQKVYWTDGKNQPRMINIANVKYHTKLDGQFDFVQEVALRERVKITKKTDGAGLFPPGTVKYVITYYKKYGQETNIVYDSPLYYPIKGERACSPDELSGDSFEIKVTGLDLNHGFEYIRLYSIVRTTDNATPIVRIVADKELAKLPSLPADDPDYNPNLDLRYALFVDTNTTGEIVDPTILQYVGGKEVIAQTFDQKNNTLFLGNIELVQKSATEVLGNTPLGFDAGFKIGNYIQVRNAFDNGGYAYQYTDGQDLALDNEKIIGIRTNKNGQDFSFYQFSNQMTASKHWQAGYDIDCPITYREHNGNSSRIKIFKYGETYRFGIQFQNTKGNWSEVIPLYDNKEKDFKNEIKPITDEWSSVGVFGMFRYVLPNNAVKKLLDGGYVRARLVCCYPNNVDRTILTQGVINPTVYNNAWTTGEDENGNPKNNILASWFFRPIEKLLDHRGKYTLPCNHNERLSHVGQTNCEIQSIKGNQAEDNYSWFYVNQDIQTFNSPEIELDESIRTLSLDDVTTKIVGYVPVNSWSYAAYVEATSPAVDYFSRMGPGLENQYETQFLNIYNARGGSHSLTRGRWRDRQYYHYNFDDNNIGILHNYPLYAFHRKGSLANYVRGISSFTVNYTEGGHSHSDDINIVEGAVLQSKVISHLLYSASSIYYELNSIDLIANRLNIKGFNIVDVTEAIPTKLPNDVIYYGNVNDIAPLTKTLSSYTINDYNNDKTRGAGSYPFFDLTDNGMLGNQFDPKIYCSDPISITYNSIAHGVINSNFGSSDEYLALGGSDINSYLFLAEVHRNTSVQNKFGGKPSPQTIYTPCGPVVDLRECEDEARNIHKSPILLGLEGDHYYQRYDCLKTYPRSIEDNNQIVEILSFMCETRINLDGRYDRNRGLSDNTTITNANFNLINRSYTQSNNFFRYTPLDRDTSAIDKYSNLITWTKTKTNGEAVDAWTNITMASTADAEGVCGEINKIINVNDTLYNFQDHGIAAIGYNEKTAISTENDVPLEIANSGKFSGLKYLTRDIGCQNKWSICSSKNGIFFIDDSRQELLTIGQGVQSLSTAHGFDAFFIQELPDSEHFKPWTPYEPKNFIAFYDKLGNDVLYINKRWCLAWSEQSKTFTSFYSYNDVPIMANVGTHLLMWDIHTPLEFDIDVVQVEETYYEYGPQTIITIEEIEHKQDTEPEANPIFDDDNYKILTFYHYKEGSEYNEDLTPTSVGTNIYMQSDGAVEVYARNTLANLKNSWIQHVVAATNYNSEGYRWDAHYILSLEFRKNGNPFIIQFEVEGTHMGPNVGNYNWLTEPELPRLKIRTLNVTDEEFDRIKFFLGGYLEPTFNTGNVQFSSTTQYKSGGLQPWDNADDGFIYNIDGTDRELLCIANLYDLTKEEVEINGETKYRSANPIRYWHNQGNPFRSSSIYDQKATIDESMYDKEDLKYNTTTTKEIIEHKEIVWQTVKKTRMVPHYEVRRASCNIWAARELVENNLSICGKFFGYYQPYWMTLVCDGITDKGYAFAADKVFNNIEYRADVFDRITGLPRADINLPVFDVKAAYNGYQAYKPFPIDAIRKFNIWRAQLPRATYYDEKTQQFVTTRDRVRNPFCYIKLMHTNGTDPNFKTLPFPNRMVLHDLIVYFDMK